MYYEALIKTLAIEKGNNLPVINLETDRHYLPIVIGYNEAMSISMALEKKEFIRPLTHDLMVNIIRGVGYELEGAYIYKLEDGTFYAKIRIVHKDSSPEHKKIIEIDCRPSDSIAICTRLQSKIYVEERVLDIAGIPKESE